MIPPFNTSGVLPPYLGKDATVRALVSPYDVTATELVGRFATSPERINILKGLFAYRAQLRALEIVAGHQLLDGSFTEDVETLEGRAPGDVDVLTFAFRPGQGSRVPPAWGEFLGTISPALIRSRSRRHSNARRHYIDLDLPPPLIVSHTQYWFSLFSHRRTGVWQGMLRLPLVSDDTIALESAHRSDAMMRQTQEVRSSAGRSLVHVEDLLRQHSADVDPALGWFQFNQRKAENRD